MSLEPYDPQAASDDISGRWVRAAQAAKARPPRPRWVVWSVLSLIATPFVLAAYFIYELFIRLLK